MILGLSISAFTAVHVVISLVAVGAGLVVFLGMLLGDRLPGWTALFLATTLLTSVTGFLFPFSVVTPAIVFGVVSLVLLAVAIVARYVYRMAGIWRPAYIASALAALYLNAVVAIVQGFAKLSFLQPLAPTQSEPPFLIAQAVLLATFVVLGLVAVWRFRPATAIVGAAPA